MSRQFKEGWTWSNINTSVWVPPDWHHGREKKTRRHECTANLYYIIIRTNTSYFVSVYRMYINYWRNESTVWPNKRLLHKLTSQQFGFIFTPAFIKNCVFFIILAKRRAAMQRLWRATVFLIDRRCPCVDGSDDRRWGWKQVEPSGGRSFTLISLWEQFFFCQVTLKWHTQNSGPKTRNSSCTCLQQHALKGIRHL